MCVLYVSVGFKVRPRTFGCIAMRSVVLFIFTSRFLLYSAGSGVNRVHVVLPGFNKDTDKGTSYRPISLLSVIADTGEEPSSLHNSKHTKHAHATRVQNTTTALHTK